MKPCMEKRTKQTRLVPSIEFIRNKQNDNRTQSYSQNGLSVPRKYILINELINRILSYLFTLTACPPMSTHIHARLPTSTYVYLHPSASTHVYPHPRTSTHVHPCPTSIHVHPRPPRSTYVYPVTYILFSYLVLTFNSIC